MSWNVVSLIAIVWLDSELNCLIVWLGFGNLRIMIKIMNCELTPRKEKGELKWLRFNLLEKIGGKRLIENGAPLKRMWIDKKLWYECGIGLPILKPFI